jgi:hypothetical protein
VVTVHSLTFKHVLRNRGSFQARVQLGASDGGKLDQDLIIFDTTVNLCKINSGMTGNFYMKYILSKLIRSSNFTYGCPFEKVLNGM